jgi:adenosylhomocysteine nucleosidase
MIRPMSPRSLLTAALLVACATPTPKPTAVAPAAPKAVVVISANTEWKVVLAVYPDAKLQPTPWGDEFERSLDVGGRPAQIVFLHGGWGKVAAAGSAQYAIDRWHPDYIINLGTCGGFAGAIDKHAVVLADRTVIYDIKEAMGDSAEAIADYSVALDLSWLAGTDPSAVTKTLLVSGDRDLVPSEIDTLATRYGAVAGDWESGAIAYTCARNHQRVLILRGVTDLVGKDTCEACGSMETFAAGADVVMRRLLGELPAWLARCPSPGPAR